MGLGLAVGAASAAANGLRAQIPKDPEAPPKTEGSEPISLLTGAFLGMAAEAAELASKAFGQIADAAEPVASWAASPPFLRGVADAAAGGFRLMDGVWKSEQSSAQRSAEEFVQGLIPQVTGAALDQIDLTSLVQRVDLNSIISDIDVDAIVNSIDIDAIIAKVDINEIVSRVDLNAVAAGIDVDAIIERVDMNAIIDRVDVSGIAQQVIEDIDLPGIVRESSGAMASETVQETRLVGHGRRPVRGASRRSRCCGARRVTCKVPGSPEMEARTTTGESSPRLVIPAALEQQGRLAGVVSRTMVMVLDLIAVAVIVTGSLYLVAGVFRLVTRPRLSIGPPSPPKSHLRGAAWSACIYLTSAWSTTGRTIGKRIMGLRVVDRRGRRLHLRPRLPAGRACTVLPDRPVLVRREPENRSVQDILLRTLGHLRLGIDVSRVVIEPATSGSEARSAPGACRRCTGRRGRSRRRSCRSAPPR